MTVVTSKLLDVSNHDFATFDAACLAAGGYSIILGCQIANTAAQMAERAAKANLPMIGAYVFLKDPGQMNIPEGVNRGIVICQLYGIKRLWLDCEASGITAAEIAGARRQVEAVGLSPGIYTGRWAWESYGTGTTHSDLPLWHAEYGSNNPAKPRTPVTEVSYGGWARPDIHQYSSTIVACGRGRDHNYLYDWAQDAQGDEMSQADKELLYRIAAAVTGAPAVEGGVQGDVAKALNEWNATGNALIQGLQATNTRVAELTDEVDRLADVVDTLSDTQQPAFAATIADIRDKLAAIGAILAPTAGVQR